MWLFINNIHEKHNYNKKFDSARFFSSFNWLAETDYYLFIWRRFWDLKPENEGGNLFSLDAAIDGWVEP